MIPWFPSFLPPDVSPQVSGSKIPWFPSFPLPDVSSPVALDLKFHDSMLPMSPTSRCFLSSSFASQKKPSFGIEPRRFPFPAVFGHGQRWRQKFGKFGNFRRSGHSPSGHPQKLTHLPSGSWMRWDWESRRIWEFWIPNFF